MIPEVGQAALALALALAVSLSIFPLIGSLRGYMSWIALAKPAARGLFFLVTVAYICLTHAFINDDFSVLYVANHSNSQLPLLFKISAVWGGHEGSLLLWVLILTVWMAAVSVFTRQIPETIVATVLSVMGIISVGFLIFLIFTSNPFERLVFAPADGRDLNPLLQDIGLAIHPPMLYLGYVGFSVVFAFAITAMLLGRLDAAWARWSRPWTNIAWMFLTIGIALGSWWAYYELGWGGWWFWDPVENASFMPWLIGTALIHSLAATEKRGVFKAWAVLLAILTFSLSLLGTFLVRSGILTSVHTFASDPTRGLYILIFLILVVGGSLTLYAWRAPKIMSQVQFELISKETVLLLNNVFFGVLCFSVILGTIYPLALDAMGLGKISVGPPYFNFLFTIIGLPLVLFVGIGIHFRWKKDNLSRIRKPLIVGLLVSLCIGLVFTLILPTFYFSVFMGLSFALFIIFQSLEILRPRLRFSNFWGSLIRIPLGVWGMLAGHIGLAVFIIGVVMTNFYSVESDIRMKAGDTYQINQYTFTFNGVKATKGPNYHAIEGKFTVKNNDTFLTHLYPQKRTYQVQKAPMTEAAIDAGLTRDLYIALGEPLENQQTWAVRIYYKSYVRWIWLGALIMALGGFLGATDRRYRTGKVLKSQIFRAPCASTSK